jgi:hypothetical protein
LKVDQSVRDMIFVEKIVKLFAIPRSILCEDAQPGKLAVALQPLPAHDERAHDRLANTRQLCERLAKPICGHFQNFALIGFASRASQRRGAHERRHVPNETARARGREDLLLPVARLEDFQLAAQDRRQPDIMLARFVYQFAAPHDAARAEGFQHSELPVIELREGDALRIAVELVVIVEFGHKRIRSYYTTTSYLLGMLASSFRSE